MSWKGYAALFLVLCLAVPSVAGANELAGRWWDRPGVARRLGLTDAEKTTLDGRFNEARRNLLDLKNQVEKERLELDIALETEPLDQDAAMKRFQELEQARARLSAERFRFLLEIRSLLGRERFQDLKELFASHRRRPGREPAPGRPGPPDAPPPWDEPED